LAGRIGGPEGDLAIGRALAKETAVRLDPALRAERFVEVWRNLSRQSLETEGWRDAPLRQKIEARMQGLANGLERDPKVAAILAGRRTELGLPPVGAPGLRLAQELVRALGVGRDRGLER
jgi:hypothetical protein